MIGSQFAERRRVVTGVTVVMGQFWTVFKQNINKTKMYPYNKRFGMVTNIGSKYF